MSQSVVQMGIGCIHAQVGLVRQVVVVPAEPRWQLHEAAAGQVNRVVADAQHLLLLGQVMVLRQVVGQCRRIHLVSIQRERHRRQRQVMHGQRDAALRNGRLDPRRIPLDGVPAAGDVGAVADEHRNQTVGIAMHGVRLRIDRRAVFTVGEFHGHREVGVVHQLVRGVTHHGLITDLAVAALGEYAYTGKQHQKKDVNLSHFQLIIYFSFLLFAPSMQHLSFSVCRSVAIPGGVFCSWNAATPKPPLNSR